MMEAGSPVWKGAVDDEYERITAKDDGKLSKRSRTFDELRDAALFEDSLKYIGVPVIMRDGEKQGLCAHPSSSSACPALEAIVAVNPENGRVRSRRRGVIRVHGVPASVPCAAVCSRIVRHQRARRRVLPGVGVGVPFVGDGTGVCVRVVPRAQERRRRRVPIEGVPRGHLPVASRGGGIEEEGAGHVGRADGSGIKKRSCIIDNIVDDEDLARVVNVSLSISSSWERRGAVGTRWALLCEEDAKGGVELVLVRH